MNVMELSSVCACLGPQFNEPECPCRMHRLGLPPSPERLAYIKYQNSPEGKAEQERAMSALRAMFDRRSER